MNKAYSIRLDEDMWEFIERRSKERHKLRSEVLKEIIVQEMIDHDQVKTLNDIIDGKAEVVERKRW